MRAARKPARKASPTPVGSTFAISGTAPTTTDSSPSRSIRTPGGAEGDDPGADAGEDLLAAPAGLLGDEAGLVLVGEEDLGAVDERPDQVAVTEGELLRGVGQEPVAALAALLGVAQHPLRVVRADDHVVGVAHAVHDRLELDLAGLAHRAGVEAGDLRVGGVVGAHEARGVPGLGDVHRVAVDVVALEPRAVVGEVLADRPDQHRTQAQVAEAEADVGGAPAASYLEVLDEEGHRQLVELVDHQAVGELAREGHQVVGRDRSGYEEGHAADTTPRYGSGYASVANSVDPMTTSRRPAPLFSDELGTPAEMAADGRETTRNLGLQTRLERAAQAAVAPAPSLRFDDYPAEVGKREIRVSDAAARIANALHLHLD